MDPLGRELMMALLDGTETTLLLLETANSPAVNRDKQGAIEEVSEEQLLDSLNDLKKRGLVNSREEKTWAGASGGIPECELGRPQMVWWDLTKDGRVLANQDVERLRKKPKRPEDYLRILPADWDPNDAVVISPEKRKILLALLAGPAGTGDLAALEEVPGFVANYKINNDERGLDQAALALEALKSVGLIDSVPEAPDQAEANPLSLVDSKQWKLTAFGLDTAAREWGKIG